MAGSDHYFRTWCLSFLPSVPTFQNLAKQTNSQVRIVIATGGTVGLAEWIIDVIHVLCLSNLSLADILISGEKKIRKALKIKIDSYYFMHCSIQY